MTHPRRIEPQTTYLITRRTLRRHHLLRPDPTTNNAITFALALAAKRYEIRVHAFCAMSTHIHLVVTDVRGDLPRFLQWFHRVVALILKVHRKWEGTFWDSDKTSVVRLESRRAIIEKIAYTLANPVQAGLVRASRIWPGARTVVDDIGRGRHAATRPRLWFDPSSERWPEVAELAIELPETEAADPARFREEVGEALARHEGEATTALRQSRRKVLGAAVVMRTSPNARASSEEPTRSRNPTLATGASGRDALLASVAALRRFRCAYRAAREQWSAGVRDVAFPFGTWWMRVAHGATVHPDRTLCS